MVDKAGMLLGCWTADSPKSDVDQGPLEGALHHADRIAGHASHALCAMRMHTNRRSHNKMASKRRSESQVPAEESDRLIIRPL